MYFLPTETKLDIFKYLNFDQLFSIKQTNLYFRDFINKYEGELARMELFDISIVDINKFKPMACKLIKPKTGDFNFPLDDELEEKWENGLEEPIRLYLHNYDFDSDFVVCLSKEVVDDIRYYRLLQLPKYIQSKDEIKIVRNYLNKIFNYSFKYANFTKIIFNPKLIDLLFENDKIPIQFYVQNCWLRPIRNPRFYGQFLPPIYDNIANSIKFALKYLFISKSLKIDFEGLDLAGKYIDILFKILMNGDKFYEVFMSHNLVMPIIFSLLVKHIETSKDCSKIVANIAFDGFYFPFDLTKKPGIIEEGVLETDSLKFTKYQLSNKYNSKIKFSILYKHEYEKIRNVEIKRINLNLGF